MPKQSRSVRNRDIMPLISALQNISKKKHPDISFRIEVAELMHEVTIQAEKIQPLESQLAFDYAEQDESGDPIVLVDDLGNKRSDSPVISPNMYMQWFKERDELLNQTFTVSYCINKDELNKLRERIDNKLVGYECEPEVIFGLRPIFTDTETVHKEEVSND